MFFLQFTFAAKIFSKWAEDILSFHLPNIAFSFILNRQLRHSGKSGWRRCLCWASFFCLVVLTMEKIINSSCLSSQIVSHWWQISHLPNHQPWQVALFPLYFGAFEKLSLNNIINKFYFYDDTSPYRYLQMRYSMWLCSFGNSHLQLKYLPSGQRTYCLSTCST